MEANWGLHQDLGSRIWQKFGRAHVDLFASSENTKCPRWYLGVMEQTQSLGVDALVHSPWPTGLLYAFPLMPLIPHLLQRIREERCRVILVAPAVVRAHWYPLLMRLAVDLPWQIPHWPDALSQVGGHIRGPPPSGGSPWSG